MPRGVHAALIGDNGVGETTLVRVLAGQLNPGQRRWPMPRPAWPPVMTPRGFDLAEAFTMRG